MLRKSLLGICAGMLLAWAYPAAATPVDFEISSLDISANSSEPGLVLSAQSLADGASFSLDEYESLTFDAVLLGTDVFTSVDPDDLTPKPITVTFNFAAPPGAGSPTVTGTTVGVQGAYFFTAVDGVQVTWDAPVVVDTGDIQFEVKLNDVQFPVQWVWYNGTGIVTAEVTHLGPSANPHPHMPEPAALLLFGVGGTIVASSVRRKMRATT